MRSSLIVPLMWILMAATGRAESKWESQPARDCATAYFEALMQGDTERANALVAVPFSFDRKEVLKNKEDVDQKHQQIAEKKGKRKVPEYTVSNTKDAPALDPTVFPEHEVFRIQLLERKDHIDIYVTKASPPKVIGFSD